MTREEHLIFCKRCLNRKMDFNKGIVCGLTDEIAAFEDSCASYSEDISVPAPVTEEAEPAEESYLDVSILSEKLQENFRKHQNLPLALAGGMLLMFLCAFLWAIITISTEYQIGYMAVGVGIVIGLGVRYFGAGVDPVFRYLGATLALLACLLGNLFSQVGFAAHVIGFSYWDTLMLIDSALLIAVYKDSFSAIDLFFYAIAVFEGYKFSVRPISTNIDDGFDTTPPLANLRMPAIAGGILLIALSGFGIGMKSSGSVSLSYENGQPMAEGEYTNGREQGLWRYYNEEGMVLAIGEYENGLEHGEWTQYYGTGVTNINTSFEHGMRHGWEVNYDETGSVIDSTHYQMGREEGRFVSFFPDGQMAATGFYKRGKPDGKWQYFHSNGTVASEGERKENLPVGTWTDYDSLGNRIKEVYFDDEGTEHIQWATDFSGKIMVENGNGYFYNYYPDGTISGECEIVDGYRNGPFVTYYPDGSIFEKGSWQDNESIIDYVRNSAGDVVVENGTGEYVSYSGDVITQMGTLLNGRKEAAWLVYFPDTGVLMSETTYSQNVMDGPVTYYFPNGTLEVQGQFTAGRQSGMWTWYHPNGEVDCTIEFVDGEKSGEQLFYNDRGYHVKTEFYEAGELVDEELAF